MTFWSVSVTTAQADARSDIATRDRLPSLTGLRFWAALLVVLYHLTTQVGTIQPVSAMVMYGRTGVTFFFVLSGFVLAWTYSGRPIPVLVFFWRRFARLWPLVAVTGVISLLAYALIGTRIHGWQAATTFVFPTGVASVVVPRREPGGLVAER